MSSFPQMIPWAINMQWLFFQNTSNTYANDKMRSSMREIWKTVTDLCGGASRRKRVNSCKPYQDRCNPCHERGSVSALAMKDPVDKSVNFETIHSLAWKMRKKIELRREKTEEPQY
jgi:hypothetical protein